MSKFKKSGATRLFALIAVLAITMPIAHGVLAQAQGDYSLTVEVRKESRDGDLIPNFQVQLLGIPTGVENGQGQKIAVLATDDQGQATFEGLPEGLYQAVNVPYEEGRSCSALPSELVELNDETMTGNAVVIVECGDTAAWQLLLLALPAVTVGDPITP